MKKWSAALTAGLALFVLGGIVFAKDEGRLVDKPRADRPKVEGDRPKVAGDRQKGPMIGGLWGKLDLTEEQKQTYQKLATEVRAKAKEIQDRIKALQEELKAAQKTLDDGMLATLTDEQKAKYQQLLDEQKKAEEERRNKARQPKEGETPKPGDAPKPRPREEG